MRARVPGGFNAGEAPARVTVQTATPSAPWDGASRQRLRRRRAAPNGRVTVPFPPLTAILLRAESTCPSAAVTKVTLKIRPDELQLLVRLAATHRRSIRLPSRSPSSAPGKRSGRASARTTRRRTASSSTRATTAQGSRISFVAVIASERRLGLDVLRRHGHSALMAIHARRHDCARRDRPAATRSVPRRSSATARSS